MSGGNKRRRKKCRWNICHLGINVVQSIIVLLQKTDVENHGVQLKILKMLATWNQEVGDIVIIIVLMANYLNKINFHTSEIRQSFPIVYSLTYFVDFQQLGRTKS